MGFNEWNSAFLYGTDLLIFALLVLWFLRQSTFYAISQNVDSRSKIIFSNYDWFLVGFLAVSAISISNTSNQILGLYQLLKLAEFSLLYFYLKSGGFGFKDLKVAFGIWLASGFFQAALAIFQYIRQADLGLRFLGETVLSPDLFNVAIFLVNGEKILRPYGTTPHPNVLALFLFMALFAYYFYCFVCRETRQLQNNNPAPFGDKLIESKNTEAARRDILKIKQWKKNFDPEWCWGTSIIGLIMYGVLLFSFFLTFSRTIIFVWAAACLILFFRNVKKEQIKRLAMTTILVIAIFSILFWPQVMARLGISFQEEAVSLRGFYNKAAFLEKPFFGVGLGNFVNWFKEINPGLAQNLYQPVHNIYLLIFSETGILGLAAFLLFLIFMAKSYLSVKVNQPFYYSFFIIFLSLLFFGLFDHFLWTLQQGQIIFWLMLGLISRVPIAQLDRA